MSYKVLTPEEAASLIKHGHHIGLSGFTPAGTAKLKNFISLFNISL